MSENRTVTHSSLGNSGEIILVTGASSGLGRAIALQLGKPGVTLALTGRTASALEEISSQVQAQGAKVVSKALDFAHLQGLEEWLDDLVSMEIPISQIYHCAAANIIGSLKDIPLHEWEKIYHVNLLSAGALISKLYPSMVKRRAGKIVLISSVTWSTGFALASPYVASKYAIHVLWLSLYPEARKHGVNIHLSVPGAFASQLFDRSTFHASDATTVKRFLQRYGFYSISCEKAAAKLISAVRRGAPKSYFPVYARPLEAISRRFPIIGTQINRRFVSEIQGASPRKLKHKVSDWSKQVILVTGTGSGIGLQLTRDLITKGAFVIAVDLNLTETEKIQSDRLKLFESDITQPDSLSQVSSWLTENSRSLTLLINNAGVTRIGETHCFDLKEWKRILDVNYFGSISCIKQMYPFLAKGEGAGVVNISSLTGIGGYATAAIYAASKGALVGLTLSSRQDLQSQGIFSTLVCPSYVRTSIFEGVIPKQLEKVGVEKSFLSKPVTTQVAAAEIISGLEKGKKLIVFPFSGKLLFQITRFAPAVSHLLQRRLLASYFKNMKNGAKKSPNCK